MKKRNEKNLYGAVPMSHLFINAFVKNGDVVVDATCGNGSDTLLLAQLVGDCGRVYAFDIQKSAIENSKEKLKVQNLLDRVTFLNDSHHKISHFVKEDITAAVFNLGYLPSGEKTITTSFETTKSGIESSLKILKPSGVLIITLYPGHNEGGAESRNLLLFVEKLPQKKYNCWRTMQPNASSSAPYNLIIQKVEI